MDKETAALTEKIEELLNFCSELLQENHVLRKKLSSFSTVQPRLQAVKNKVLSALAKLPSPPKTQSEEAPSARSSTDTATTKTADQLVKKPHPSDLVA